MSSVPGASEDLSSADVEFDEAGQSARDEAEPANDRKVFDEAYVKKLREEAAANRVRAKQLEQKLQQMSAQADKDRQEIIGAITKALGLESEEPPSVEQLTHELQASQRREADKERELRYLQVENAARDVAYLLGADVPTLMDSRSFSDALRKLDPSDEDFRTKLEALVRGTLESNPRYKATRVAPVSGGDFSGGTGTTKERQRPHSLYEAVSSIFSAGS